jgi:nucleoside-diphosphate-sugar epimerase
MPTAVVTGVAGFHGSHLCGHLLSRDYRVICIDNLDTGSLQNVEYLRGGELLFLTDGRPRSGDVEPASIQACSRRAKKSTRNGEATFSRLRRR